MPGRRTIGVDVGGSKLLAGAVDTDFFVHRRVQRSVSGLDQSALLDVLAEAVQETREHAGGEVRAAGFALPSVIDRRSGRSVSSRHAALVDVPLADVMAERLDLPVVVDSEAKLAVLAEQRAGAARGASDVLMLVLDATIGGGLILGGELYHGASGAAGELGHVTIDLDGPPCMAPCPGRGCLNSLASGTALAQEARRIAQGRPESALARAVSGGREVDGALVAELAHDGDPGAREALALIGTRLGAGIASLVNVFNPEVVVLGGEVVGAGELLLGQVREEVARRALAPARDQVRIVAARFGIEAALIGAAALALEGIASRGRR